MGRFENITYSRASRDHITGLTQLRAVFGGSRDQIQSKFFSELEREEKGGSASRLFVALYREQVVGYGRLTHFSGELGESFYLTQKPLPRGWYVRGCVVDPDFSEVELVTELVRIRLNWLAEQASSAYCFLQNAGQSNLSIFYKFGFEEVSRNWKLQEQSTVTPGSHGILLKVDFY